MVKADQPFEIKVKVEPHLNTVEHSIKRIEVYFNEEGRAFNPIRRTTTNLTPVYSEPEVGLTIKLKKNGTFHAEEYFNIYGLWEGR